MQVLWSILMLSSVTQHKSKLSVDQLYVIHLFCRCVFTETFDSHDNQKAQQLATLRQIKSILWSTNVWIQAKLYRFRERRHERMMSMDWSLFQHFPFYLDAQLSQVTTKRIIVQGVAERAGRMVREQGWYFDTGSKVKHNRADQTQSAQHEM